MECVECKKELTYNEMGLSKKLLGRGTKTFYCKKCLAKKIDVSEERLNEKMKQFIQAGCTLFVEE